MDAGARKYWLLNACECVREALLHAGRPDACWTVQLTHIDSNSSHVIHEDMLNICDQLTDLHIADIARACN